MDEFTGSALSSITSAFAHALQLVCRKPPAQGFQAGANQRHISVAQEEGGGGLLHPPCYRYS